MKKILVLTYILMSTTSGWAKNKGYSNCSKSLQANTAVVTDSVKSKKQTATQEVPLSY